jgi:DNA modification methylase
VPTLNPYLSDADFTLYHGDALEVLRELPSESVDCVVTSPPYWGLRDYSAEGQLGLEPTPEEYVERMVEVFRDVRRVLAVHGTCWVNLGDSYAGGGAAGTRPDPTAKQMTNAGSAALVGKPNPVPAGLKPKDLCGIPWRLAFALQADGWYLRSDIVWSKPNPMPESVTDRPTKAHEYVFLLTKQPRYFFDQEAVREPHTRLWDANNGGSMATTRHHDAHIGGSNRHERPYPEPHPAGRNIRSVWEIATQRFSEAHFATFPQALVERCILAGTSEKGDCPECGAPWVREVERTKYEPEVMAVGVRAVDESRGDKTRKLSGAAFNASVKVLGETWRPSCECGPYWEKDGERTHTHPPQPIPATVLDPFMGSGTVALVARRLGRRSVGIELNDDYCKMAAKRLQQLSLLTEA